MLKSGFRYGVSFASVAAIAAAAWLAWSAAPAMAPVSPSPSVSPQLIAQGRYLALAGDCAACHTAPGGRAFAGGLALATPFGSITASNITPDRTTGIGAWSEAAFARALRQGISRDGHNLYPAMPYTAYTRLTDADIHALKAYIDSLAPVQQVNPANRLAFPFNIRALLRVWNLLFFSDARFATDTAKSTAWNRGAYLVEGLGHCGVCHTAKNMLGGDGPSLQGGALLGWYAPELSGNRYSGLGAWPRQDLVAYLKTARAPQAIANGPMLEVVEKSTSRMSDADLAAIVAYITDRPGSNTHAPVAAGVSYAQGADLYQRHCAACHGSSGRGAHAMVPRLADSSSLRAPDPASLIQTVLHGGADGTHMPAFADRLSDRQIADILSYVRNDWGNVARPVDWRAVRSLR